MFPRDFLQEEEVNLVFGPADGEVEEYMSSGNKK